jgi:hypothetical protein
LQHLNAKVAELLRMAQEAVLAEVEALQEAGPSEEDIKTALAVELRAHEEAVQENTWWLDVRTAPPLPRSMPWGAWAWLGMLPDCSSP